MGVLLVPYHQLRTAVDFTAETRRRGEVSQASCALCVSASPRWKLFRHPRSGHGRDARV